MGVYLRAKFEVSSIILMGFRQGGGVNFCPPPPQPQNEPLKSPPRLGLKGRHNSYYFCGHNSFFFSFEAICLLASSPFAKKCK